ncbi:MAG TPA: NAD(P)-dependent oxidoreductase [Desulfobacterales bacterium]|nr:NAD(P)-dependent oxidoreductase [Desulfobacterales bacterium]
MKVVIITGASGFIASAICVDLVKDYHVVAIDRREPSRVLRESASSAIWAVQDISDESSLRDTFTATKERFGLISVVIHFAAFCHFGRDWHPEYQSTNIDGTAKLISIASELGASRIIFASSIAAMEPPAPGTSLTTESPACDLIPYATPKRLGEELLRKARCSVPSVILRIGGVFSDWCELPPLHSLIRYWTSRGPLGRVVPGRGQSGIPYIHRSDLVSLVRKVISKDKELGEFEIFLASQNGSVSHNQLFPIVRHVATNSPIPKPIYVHPTVAKIGLYAKCAHGKLTGHMPYERPWMLAYVDRPWEVDTTRTQTTLDWDCTSDKGILDRLPMIIQNKIAHPEIWEERNVLRNEGRYSYYDDLNSSSYGRV